MDALIYDRTAADVASDLDKAYWQVSDLERITEWIDYLAGLFGDVLTTTDYALGDQLNIDELLINTEAIRDGHTWSDTPVTPTETSFNYVKANAVEKILYDANAAYVAREASIKYSGSLYSGFTIPIGG